MPFRRPRKSGVALLVRLRIAGQRTDLHEAKIIADVETGEVDLAVVARCPGELRNGRHLDRVSVGIELAAELRKGRIARVLRCGHGLRAAIVDVVGKRGKPERVVAVIIGRGDRQIGRRREIERTLDVALLEATRRVAGDLVRIAAVEMLVATGNAHCEDILDQRVADAAAEAVLAVIATKSRDVGVGVFQRRLLRHVIDRAGKGVATVQCADRTLDDLDPLDVDQAEIDRGVVRNIDAIEEHCDVGIARTTVEVGLAADDRVGAEFGTAAGDLQAGGEIRDVAQIPNVAVGE